MTKDQALVAIRHGLAQARAAIEGPTVDAKVIDLALRGIDAAQAGYAALSDTDRPLAPSEPKPCTSGPDASFSGYAHRTETEFDGRMGSQ